MEPNQQNIVNQPVSPDPPKSHLNLLLTIIVGALMLLMGFGGGYLLFANKTETTKVDTAQVSPTIMQPSSENVDNLNTVTDSQIPGFSLKYETKDWDLDVQDIIDCNDVQCGPAHGREIRLTSKQYGDSLFLSVSLETHTPDTIAGGPGEICFLQEHIKSIGNEWYKAMSPFETIETEASNKLWSRYFYKNEDFHVNKELKCITGALNLHAQNSIPVKYKGQQVYIESHLQNQISVGLNEVADEIIRSISFQ